MLRIDGEPGTLSDIQRERLSAPSAVKQSTVASTGKDAPVTNSKETSSSAKGAPEIWPEFGASLTVQQDTPPVQGETQDPKSFADGDGGEGVGSHSGGVILTFEWVEALQAARGDSREETANALRRLAESVSSGELPCELFQADYDETADHAIRSRPSKLPGGSKEIGFSQTGQSGQVAEIVVPLAEGIVRGRPLVACPGWVLLMLLFLAATSLALIAEQGLLNAGMLQHFLESKAWIFVKLVHQVLWFYSILGLAIILQS